MKKAELVVCDQRFKDTDPILTINGLEDDIRRLTPDIIRSFEDTDKEIWINVRYYDSYLWGLIQIEGLKRTYTIGKREL
jgi:hypothetical protein